MRTVVELTGVTARLLTDCNRLLHVDNDYHFACMVEIQSYLVSTAVCCDQAHSSLVSRKVY